MNMKLRYECHQVVGVEKGGLVGIEEGGVKVAVEEGAVQVGQHLLHFAVDKIYFCQVDMGNATVTIGLIGLGFLLFILLATAIWVVRKGKVTLFFFVDHEHLDKLQVASSIAERNLVGNEESSSKSSIVRPLACGLLTAFLVLLIGLAAWALVGIDQKSQLLARFADVG